MSVDLCEEAVRDKRRAERNFNRWEGMVQVLGVAMTVAAVATLALLFVGPDDRTATLVAGAAAVASGGGFIFVLNRRANARTEMRAANSEMREACGAARRPVTRGESADGSISTAILNALTDDVPKRR